MITQMCIRWQQDQCKIDHLGEMLIFFIFIDGRTRFTWIYFIIKKSDVFEYFNEFKNMVEKKTGNIKILRSDQGGECTLEDFIKYCMDNGIQKQYTISHTPQQNGVAERKNRTLVECAQSMIKSNNLLNVFCVETIIIVVYLNNSNPTNFLKHKTPYEAFDGYKSIVNHLRNFGSKVFSHVPKEDRRKCDAKSIKCIFIGYCVDHKAYKMYDLIIHKVFASRDVVFHEYIDEVQKEDDQDLWKLPKEGIESAKAEEIEDQQDDVEDQNCIEATSNQSTPRKCGAIQQSNDAL
jgi:hypothetical protein